MSDRRRARRYAADDERFPILGPPERTSSEPLFGFLFLGFVGNLCINFIFQEMPYFNSVFGDTFVGLCGTTYAISNNIGQLIVVFAGRRIPFGPRIYISCCMLGISMTALPMLALFEVPFGLYAALGLIVVMGLSVAILSSAGFGLTALCSDKSRRFYNVGTSLPGVLAWPFMMVLDFLIKSTFKVSNDTLTALGLMLFAGACFFIMVPYYGGSLGNSETVLKAIAFASEPPMRENSRSSKKSKRFTSILFKTLPMALSVWIVMCTSMMVFPDQVTKWKSTKPDSYPGGEFGYQNLVIYSFQLFDVVSRILVANKIIELNRSQVMAGALARGLVIPLFLLASEGVSVFKHDVFHFSLCSLWGLTYGLVLAWGMILGPTQVSQTEAEVAGYIMSFALVNGLFFGSMIAFLLRYVPNKFAEVQNYKQQCAFGYSEHEIVSMNPNDSAIIT